MIEAAMMPVERSPETMARIWIRIHPSILLGEDNSELKAEVWRVSRLAGTLIAMSLDGLRKLLAWPCALPDCNTVMI